MNDNNDIIEQSGNDNHNNEHSNDYDINKTMAMAKQ